MKHIPERTCICCRKKFQKEDLLRIVKFNGNITVDLSGKFDGRGAYFCGSPECAQKLLKSKALDRAFHEKVNEDVYNKLISVATETKR